MRSLCWRLNVFVSGRVFCLGPILLSVEVYELRALVFEGRKAMLPELKDRLSYIFINNSCSRRCVKPAYLKQ